MNTENENPYQSPLEVGRPDERRKPGLSVLGLVSVMLSTGPIVVVLALIVAFNLGLPSPGLRIRTLALGSFGLLSALAVLTGTVALTRHFSWFALLGLGLGACELLLLAGVLFLVVS